MTKTKQWVRTGIAMALMCGAGAAFAQVKIGVTLSTTGPAASLGIPEKNTIALLPKEIGGKTVQYIILDDGSDTGKAVQNTRKLIDEDHVDAGGSEELACLRQASDRGHHFGKPGLLDELDEIVARRPFVVEHQRAQPVLHDSTVAAPAPRSCGARRQRQASGR